MEAAGRKTQICPETRRLAVDKIADTCKNLVPSSEHLASSKINEIAIRFEEKIYSTATSQDDYLQQVSKKMLIMKGKFQNTKPNSSGSNPSPIDDNVLDPGVTKMQVTNSKIQFGPEYREKIVNKIVDVLRKRAPFNHDHLSSEVKKIALKFEERIYSRATSQGGIEHIQWVQGCSWLDIVPFVSFCSNASITSDLDDYQRKISIKMMTLQKTSQDELCNLSGSTSVTASQSIQSQLKAQHPLSSLSAKHSPAHQQKVLQNSSNELASPDVQGYTGSPYARPCTNGSSQTHVANISSENLNQQNVAGISQRSAGVSLGKGESPNISVNHEKVLQQVQQKDLALHGGPCQQQLPEVSKRFEKENVGGSVQTNTEQGHLQNQLCQTLSQPSEQTQQSDCLLQSFSTLEQNLHLMGQQNQLIDHRSNLYDVEKQHEQIPESGNYCKQPDEVAYQRHSQHGAFSPNLQSASSQQPPIPSHCDMQSTLQTSVGTSMKGQENLEGEKEGVYVKVEHIKSKYFPKLSEMFKLATADLQCYGLFSEPQDPNHVEKLKEIRQMIGIYLFLNNPKNMMDKTYEERLGSVEHTIILLLKAFSRWKLDVCLQIPSSPGTSTAGTATTRDRTKPDQ